MSSLYLEHFGLTKPPFQITPDLDFFFAGGRRGDILSALLHVAAHEEGIITLIAEVGSGKTLLARLMISRLAPNICSVYLANPSFSRDEILGAIARDLGLTELPAATEARLAALHQELLRRHGLGQRVLLVIDEAHAMPPESLEEVRLLSNLETGQHKLVNIMLFGQPELDELLSDRSLRQVRDRVVHRFSLVPLPTQEAVAYVDHRLRAAGWKGGPLFSPGAMALLIKASGGRARRINLLADKALLASYAQGLLTVQPPQVRDAVRELPGAFTESEAPAATSWLKWVAGGAVVLALCMSALAFWLWDRQRAVDPTAAVAPAVPTAQVSGAKALPPAVTLSAAPLAIPAASTPTATIAQPAAPEASIAMAAPPPALPAPAATAGSGQLTSAIVVDPTLLPYLARMAAQLGQSDMTGYTIQIAALPRDANVAKYFSFLGHHIDSSIVFAQLTNYNGRDFVSVFVGKYRSASEANTALMALPQPLKTNKPMVRTWVKIKQDQPS